MADEWQHFFVELNRFICEAARQEEVAGLQYTDYVIEKIELACGTCSNIKFSLENPHIPLTAAESTICNGYARDLEQLVLSLRVILTSWREHRLFLSSRNGIHMYRIQLCYTGRRGRPSFDVDKEQIEYLLSLSFSWSEISLLLGISRMTLYRRRIEFGMIGEETLMEISDEELVAAIEEFRHDNPYIGESMVSGYLRSRGYKVTRSRIRVALRANDPLGSAFRWPGGAIRRRKYSVAGPNSLWHIDSHHKLIRWRLVTHGGIDGYSRLIVYLKCSSNITSQTVYETFLRATGTYHLPSRVRCDQGGENVLVAQHMIERRGADRNSIIVGSSVHNQRIERLWKDMHRSVTSLYYRLFYHMEDQALLSPLNEQHIYALHYIFIPRINRALSHFIDGWNHHPIRTTHNKSPYQLFNAGILLLRHSGLSALDFFESVGGDYGVDNDIQPDVPSRDNNIIPQCSFTLTNHQYQMLQEAVDPLHPSDNYGIDLYELTLRFLQNV